MVEEAAVHGIQDCKVFLRETGQRLHTRREATEKDKLGTADNSAHNGRQSTAGQVLLSNSELIEFTRGLFLGHAGGRREEYHT
jgi:hypothetical protein